MSDVIDLNEFKKRRAEKHDSRPEDSALVEVFTAHLLETHDLLLAAVRERMREVVRLSGNPDTEHDASYLYKTVAVVLRWLADDVMVAFEDEVADDIPALCAVFSDILHDNAMKDVDPK